MPDTVPVFHEIRTGHYVRRGGYRIHRPGGCDSWQIIYTVAGRGEFRSRRSTVFSEPGQLVLLHPNILNDYSVSPEPGYWDKIWAHFYPRFNWEPLLKWPLAAPGIGKLVTDPGESREKIVQALLQMHELSRGPQYHRAGLAMNALERSLLWCDAINPDSPKRAVDEAVDRVVHLICDDLKIHRSLKELAEASGQSVSRLSHSFKREMGVTPLEFAERQRIDAACRMLGETRLSVKEIAAAVGFENQLYFSRRFRKKMGMTAQEFRRNLWPSDE